MARLFSVVGLLASLHFLGASAQDVPTDTGCVATCFGTVSSEFTTFGCSSGADWSCMCVNDSFRNGVKDCAVNGCAATSDQAFTWLDSDSSCSSVTPIDGDDSTTTAASSTAASSTATEAATSTAEASTTATATEASATETAAATSTTAAAESTAAASSTSSGAAAAAPTDASQDGQDKTDKSGDKDENTNDGSLSSGAAAGIGIGIAVCVVGIAVVATAILIRNRKRQQRLNSAKANENAMGRPPGSAGGYSEKNAGSNMEMMANRYEDMVPRTTPRNMV